MSGPVARPGDGAGGVVGPIPAGRDPVAYDRARRRVLWSLPTGLYLLGSRGAGGGPVRANLMTVSWVTQVAKAPKLVAVSVENGSLSAALIQESGVFALSVLSRADRAVVRRFVKPVSPGEVSRDGGGGLVALRGEPVVPAPSGAPVLARALGWLDCARRDEWDLGSHALFVGEVLDAGGPEPPGEHGGVLRMEDTKMSYGG